LEQSLETLREENTKLRKCIEDHIERKKQRKQQQHQQQQQQLDGGAVLATTGCSDTDTDTDTDTVQSPDELLERRRVRSHERFIEAILAGHHHPKSSSSSNMGDDDNDDDADNDNDADHDADANANTNTDAPNGDKENSSSISSSSCKTGDKDVVVTVPLLSTFSTSSGKGVIVDDKLLKVLKGFSKALASKNKRQKLSM